MKAYDIIQFLEEEYPLELQGSHDNSGLQLGSPGKNVRTIAVAYEKTLDVISRCVQDGFDMLVTHRPLSIPKRFGPPSKRWWQLFKQTMNSSDMVIYSLHENLDFGANSTAICLSKELGLVPLQQIGHYLTCKVKETEFGDFVSHVQKVLRPAYIIAVGDVKTKITKVGIVAGTAMDVGDIEFFKSTSVECYLSGDPDDFGIRLARDLGLLTINVDDYCLERPCLMWVYRLLKQRFRELRVDFIDCKYGNVQ